MISVLFLIPTLDRGGAENVLVNLVNNLDQNKFKITVQTLFDKDAQKDKLRKGIEYKSFLHNQFRGNSRLLARFPASWLYKLIVKKQYDVVVSYLEGPTTHILAGCPFPDSKRIAWVHVQMDNIRQLSVGFKSDTEAIKAYRAFDKVVFVANTVKQSFETVAGVSFENATVLYNTLNSDEILEKGREPLISGEFAEDEFNIVSVGRIISAKGYDRLAHIHKRLIDEGYKCHTYILGSGADRDNIENYLRENHLTDTFTFMGFKENPHKYVEKADLFVCSSRREGFSTAVSEALVLGVPVVSTNCSGAYELLGKNNEYGIVTDSDEESLYLGIKSMLDAAERLGVYRKLAKERGAFFSTENTVNAVEEMLIKLSGSTDGKH